MGLEIKDPGVDFLYQVTIQVYNYSKGQTAPDRSRTKKWIKMQSDSQGRIYKTTIA